MKIAILGDSFIDEYVVGTVDRICPEAPVPVLDVVRKEQRGGGAINLANNLWGLGITPTLFTITNMKLPYSVVSPKGPTILRKTRFVGNFMQLLRVDTPKKYLKEDLKKVIYPDKRNFDFIAYADYDKGIITGGVADIVDTKKRDYSLFKGSTYLKVNLKEWNECLDKTIFPKSFVTTGKRGIEYFEYGLFKERMKSNYEREVSDTSGAGDTVMATIIYCLLNGITNPAEIMDLSNKAASIVLSKFGTAPITLKELLG